MDMQTSYFNLFAHLVMARCTTELIVKEIEFGLGRDLFVIGIRPLWLSTTKTLSFNQAPKMRKSGSLGKIRVHGFKGSFAENGSRCHIDPMGGSNNFFLGYHFSVLIFWEKL